MLWDDAKSEDPTGGFHPLVLFAQDLGDLRRLSAEVPTATAGQSLTSQCYISIRKWIRTREKQCKKNTIRFGGVHLLQTQQLCDYKFDNSNKLETVHR